MPLAERDVVMPSGAGAGPCAAAPAPSELRGMHLLAELAALLTTARSTAEIGRLVVGLARQALGVERVALAVAGRRPGQLVLVAQRGLEGELTAGACFPESADFPLARAHHERAAIYLEAPAAFTSAGPEPARVAPGERAASACIPLLVGERSLGALGIGSPHLRGFDDIEQAVLLAFARQTAAAIERTELVARARRDTERLRFLAHAGELLAAALEVRETLSTLARLAVPALADWAAVDLFVDGKAERVAIAHVDPAKEALVEALARRYPPDLSDPNDGLGRVFRTGVPELVEHIPEAVIDAAAKDPAHLHILRSLQLRSYLVVPIRQGDRVRGAFSLVGAESGRRFDDDDLQLALEVARRAAASLTVSETIDELRRAEQEARDASARLELAARHKDQFLALLGHELRNPLAAIGNGVEILRVLGSTEPRLDRARDVIARQVGHMKRLLDDLLDAARISQRRLTIRRDRVDLTALVRETTGDHRANAARLDLQLTLAEPSAPVTVLGDRTRLVQILSNLLHNAKKFTPAGGHIEVGLHVAGDEAVLSVRDDGIGIDLELLPQLFQPFVAARPGSDPEHGGLGLGLSIVKGLADLHGGTASVWSAGRGRGTTCQVRLPLAASIAAPTPPTTQRASDGLRVLLVEDDPDGGEMLRTLFELEGHQVVLAVDGPSALELAFRVRPALVVCDFSLAGAMDGCAVGRELRKHPSLGSPWLVALTGFGSPEHVRRTREAGFDRHLIKPITLETLRDIVETARAPRPR